MARDEIRLRSLGEILDDGLQLWLQEWAVLTFLSLLFAVPWLASLYWTLVIPSNSASLLFPLLTAGLYLLGGLGPASCQAYLYGRGARRTVREALRRAFAAPFAHIGMRSLQAAYFLIVLPVFHAAYHLDARDASQALLVVFFYNLFLIPAVTLLVPMHFTGHAVLASGLNHFWDAASVARSEYFRQMAKAVGLLQARIVLVVALLYNLHFVMQFLFFFVTDVFLFDLAYLAYLLSFSNPAYVVGIVMVVYLLTGPYFEAVTHLYHMDSRTEHEGLDLWYRVRLLFPLTGKVDSRGKVVAIVLISLLLMGWTDRAQAQQPPANSSDPASAIKEVRKGLQDIRESGDVRGNLDRMEDLSRKLPAGTPQRVHEAIREAEGKVRSGDEVQAEKAVRELEQRLNLHEKAMKQNELPPDRNSVKKLAEAREETRFGRRERFRLERPQPNIQPGKLNPRIQLGNAPAPNADLSLLYYITITLLSAIGVAALAALVYLFARSLLGIRWTTGQAKVLQVTQPKSNELADDLERMMSKPILGNRWAEADQLAEKGQFREAVRCIYLVVLVSLHQANLIRYERTRTNGEYVRQLRPRKDIHPTFRSLTSLFEHKWYGQKECIDSEYQHTKELADAICNPRGSS